MQGSQCRRRQNATIVNSYLLTFHIHKLHDFEYNLGYDAYDETIWSCYDRTFVDIIDNVLGRRWRIGKPKAIAPADA